MTLKNKKYGTVMLTHHKKSYTIICAFSHARIQKVLSRGSNFDGVFFGFFLVDEGREDLNTTISGSSSARQRNAI